MARKSKIVGGPNIMFLLTTVMAFFMGGFKGILIWLGMCLFFVVLQCVIDKPSRDAILGLFQKSDKNQDKNN